jgi:hypothetical protein
MKSVTLQKNQYKNQFKGEFIMKKLVIFVVALSIMAVSLFPCNAKPDHFTGQWKFSKISKVEIAPNVEESRIAYLKEEYDAEDEKGIEESALAKFTADGTFNSCYLNFGKKQSHTYDPIMDREATWVFYQTSDNEGFLSFYTELDAADGNPDPILYPSVVYVAQTNTLLLTLNYIGFMVTVELTR